MVSVTSRRAALVIAAAAVSGPLLAVAPALAGPPPLAEPVPAAPMPTESRAEPPNDVIFVEVTPGTVEPGFLVGIRASCRDNSVPATVVSDAFGRVQVQPQRGLLTASPMVKDRTRPGNYRVKLECPAGETASTMLQVVKRVQPSRGPATGFGGTAGPGLDDLLAPMGLALTAVGAAVGLVAARRPRTVRGAARR